MFCKNCGAQLPDGSRFCTSCGEPVDAPAVPSAPPVLKAAPPTAEYGEKQENPYVLPAGFSAMCRHPEILAAEAEKKKQNFGCMWAVAFAPVVLGLVMGIAGYFSEHTSPVLPLALGGAVTLVLLIVAWIRRTVSLHRTKPMWEGTVTGKTKKKETMRNHHVNNRSPETFITYTLYTVHVVTDDGKEQKINRSDDASLYNYFNPGDRVRWHPGLDYYEKFDKSHDSYIFCAVCGRKNQIQKDRCENCGKPLFK